MNDPEIESGVRFVAAVDAEHSTSASADFRTAPAEFQRQEEASLVSAQTHGQGTSVAALSTGEASLVAFDGLHLLALEPAVPSVAVSISAQASMESPPPLRVADDDDRRPQASTSRLWGCKWDVEPSLLADGPNDPWYALFEDGAVPLWAEQLAPGATPERLLRYMMGTQAVLRDWRVSYLPLKYGIRRLPWVHAAADVLPLASRAMGALRTPQTDHGKHRRAAFQQGCPGVRDWMRDLQNMVEGGIITGVLLATVCTRIWSRILQPVVPVWVVAACVVEWLTTDLSTTTTVQDNAPLSHAVADVSVELVLVEIIDVLCVTTSLQEAVAFVTAARQTCRESGALDASDDHVWVQLAIQRVLWRPELSPPSSASCSMGSASSLESTVESKQSAARGDDDAVTSPWSWGLPVPLGDAPAADEMPIVWMDYPDALSRKLEAAAAVPYPTGFRTIVLDDLARRLSPPDDHLIYLEEEVNFEDMSVLRGGVRVPLRRHQMPSTQYGPPCDSQTWPDQDVRVEDCSTVPLPEHTLRLLKAVEDSALRQYRPGPAQGSHVDSADGTSDVDWRNDRPPSNNRPNTANASSGGAHQPWYRMIDMQPGKRRVRERIRIDHTAECPRSTSDALHVLSGLMLRDDVRRQLPQVEPPRHFYAVAAQLSDGTTVDVRDPRDVLVRYVDFHCDMLVSLSLLDCLTLLGDEREVVRGATVFVSAAPESKPERLELEFFDRPPEEESDDDDETAPLASGTDRRSMTYDVMLHPTVPICDAVIRRLALRSGCVNFVRALRHAAQRGIGLLQPPGLFAECVGSEGAHITVTIGLPPALMRTPRGAAVSERLGLCHRAKPRHQIDWLPNPQAALQAHIRSLTPAHAKGAACVGVPLGGWRAHPRSYRNGAERTREAGVVIPPAAIPSTALTSHLPPVSSTPFGLKPVLALGQRIRSRLFDSPDLSLFNVASQTPDDHHHHTDESRTVARRSDAPRYSLSPPPIEPASTLGSRLRHPGAVVEWAFLDSVKRRAPSTGAHSTLLRRIQRHRTHLPAAPLGHDLSLARLERDLRSDEVKEEQRMLLLRNVDMPTESSHDIISQPTAVGPLLFRTGRTTAAQHAPRSR